MILINEETILLECVKLAFLNAGKYSRLGMKWKSDLVLWICCQNTRKMFLFLFPPLMQTPGIWNCLPANLFLVKYNLSPLRE